MLADFSAKFSHSKNWMASNVNILGKMFKVTLSILLFETLGVKVHPQGTDLCCSDIHISLEYIKSELYALKDLIKAPNAKPMPESKSPALFHTHFYYFQAMQSL